MLYIIYTGTGELISTDNYRIEETFGLNNIIARYNDDDGGDVVFHCVAKKEDDKVLYDFSASFLHVDDEITFHAPVVVSEYLEKAKELAIKVNESEIEKKFTEIKNIEKQISIFKSNIITIDNLKYETNG